MRISHHQHFAHLLLVQIDTSRANRLCTCLHRSPVDAREAEDGLSRTREAKIAVTRCSAGGDAKNNPRKAFSGPRSVAWKKKSCGAEKKKNSNSETKILWKAVVFRFLGRSVGTTTFPRVLALDSVTAKSGYAYPYTRNNVAAKEFDMLCVSPLLLVICPRVSLHASRRPPDNVENNPPATHFIIRGVKKM